MRQINNHLFTLQHKKKNKFIIGNKCTAMFITYLSNYFIFITNSFKYIILSNHFFIYLPLNKIFIFIF